MELFRVGTSFSRMTLHSWVLGSPAFGPLGVWLQAHEFDLLSHPWHTQICHSEELAFLHALNGLLFEMNSLKKKKKFCLPGLCHPLFSLLFLSVVCKMSLEGAVWWDWLARDFSRP